MLGRWPRRLALWAADYALITAWQARGLLTRPDPRAFVAPPVEPGPARAPVVLLPGIYETWAVLAPLARALHARGHPVHAVPTLGYNAGPVLEMAERAVALLAEEDLHGVVLVAHSKGGLIGKQVMLSEVGALRVAGMVAVNTPFAGSRYAAWLPLRSVRALSPRAAAVLSLTAQLEVNTRIASVYPTFDPHVPGGSALAGARNVEIPTTGHFRTLTHPEVVRTVLAEVERLGGAPAREG